MLVLAFVAWRLWSPLVVLGLAALVFVSLFVVWFAEIVLFDSCGEAHLASIVKGIGAGAVALTTGAWGIRGGRRAFWALPAGLALAGLWIAGVEHVWPGGSGACLN